MKSSEELKKEYLELRRENEALKDELFRLETQRIAIEEQEKKIKARRIQICGCYFFDKQTQIGLIDIAKQKYKDSFYPVFKETPSGVTRIVKVDDKFIHLKQDGIGDVMKYKKDNGWRERIKKGYDTIDHEKALDIWEKHKN